MKKPTLDQLTTAELVDLFVANRLKQYEAELYGDTRKFRRLFDDMKAIEDTLKSTARRSTACAPAVAGASQL